MSLRTRLRILLFIGVALGIGLLRHTATAQDAAQTNGPDPREIPVPPIKTPIGHLPGVDELPLRKEMPDVLVTNGGFAGHNSLPMAIAPRRQQDRSRHPYAGAGSRRQPHRAHGGEGAAAAVRRLHRLPDRHEIRQSSNGGIRLRQEACPIISTARSGPRTFRRLASQSASAAAAVVRCNVERPGLSEINLPLAAISTRLHRAGGGPRTPQVGLPFLPSMPTTSNPCT